MWSLAVCMSRTDSTLSFKALLVPALDGLKLHCVPASQAEQLIRARLAVTPDEPRLWCALGDLNLDDDAYRKAWDCSVR